MLRLRHCSPGNAPPPPPLSGGKRGEFSSLLWPGREFLLIFSLFIIAWLGEGGGTAGTYEFSYNFNFVVIGKYVNLNILCAFRRVRRRRQRVVSTTTCRGQISLSVPHARVTLRIHIFLPEGEEETRDSCYNLLMEISIFTFFPTCGIFSGIHFFFAAAVVASESGGTAVATCQLAGDICHSGGGRARMKPIIIEAKRIIIR